MAYRVIQRSNAWGELIDDIFPSSSPLSIHPQESHAQKIGFHMIVRPAATEMTESLGKAA